MFLETDWTMLIDGCIINRRMGKREQNEKKFGNWEIFPDGGRRYFLEVLGKHGWKAKYVKEVDSQEMTLRFFQEIYDDHGNLVEIHEKFPSDMGHKPIKEK